MGMLCYPSFAAPFATHIIHLMKGLSRSIGAESNAPASPVYLFTNNAADKNDPNVASALEGISAQDVTIDHRPVVKLIPHNQDQDKGLDVVVKNEDGSEDSISLGFIAHKPQTTLVAPHLAEKLGVETEKGMFGPYIKTVPPFFGTTIPGVFSAGDAGAQATHISNAMLTGTFAGGGVANYVGEMEEKEAMERLKAKNTA